MGSSHTRGLYKCPITLLYLLYTFQGPDYNHIVGSVHLGNFIAATNAVELGFTHVLNVADNLDMVYSTPASEPRHDDLHQSAPPVVYRKIAMRDGAHNPIDSRLIAEAVDWLKSVDSERARVLVNCRAGIGRAGSVAVAYVFATNRSMSFDDAYQFVFAKRFVYPHAGLAAILYDLFPRRV